jgi:threonine dehydratase
MADNLLSGLEAIRAARARIKDVIYHSPCPYSLSLSRLCGCEIYCKLDHLQMTGSFKERGARNKLLMLTEPQRKAGVIAASAGNHGLAVAYHGKLLGIAVTVVMPKWAPLIKLTNCRSFGARVILSGETLAESRQEAQRLAREESLTYIQGFDDPEIIAGAGTMGLEILEDVPDVDAVIVPVGGGGLIAGVGGAIKALKPSVEIIGVEPEHALTLYASLQAKKVTHWDTKPTLADGLAVAEVGHLCFDIIRDVMDDLVLVNEEQIAQSILRLLELEKMVVEGAGATPLAAVLARAEQLAGKKVVLVISGGNIDVTLISRIIERGLATTGRLCRIVANISDRPGSLAALLSLIAGAGGSIKDVSHDRSFGPVDVARVTVACIIETRDFDHIKEVFEFLRNNGIQFTSQGQR